MKTIPELKEEHAESLGKMLAITMWENAAKKTSKEFVTEVVILRHCALHLLASEIFNASIQLKTEDVFLLKLLNTALTEEVKFLKERYEKFPNEFLAQEVSPEVKE